MSRPPSLELYNWHWVSWFLLQDCKFKGQDFTAKEVLGAHEEPLEHQPGLDKHWHHKRKLVRNWGSPTGRASFETIEDLPTVVVQDTSLQGSWPSQTAWWRKSFWTTSPWKVPLNACQAIPESHFSGTFLLDRWEGKCRSEKKNGRNYGYSPKHYICLPMNDGPVSDPVCSQGFLIPGRQEKKPLMTYWKREFPIWWDLGDPLNPVKIFHSLPNSPSKSKRNGRNALFCFHPVFLCIKKS